ncbi:MAG: cysteine desulfurase NifS [Eubacteriaceae bacterium]|nr:cysteine desulfurase NifS [Eubacteriaceae bacterium]
MIYLDNAATTKVSPEVLDAMIPFYTEDYGNASSIYSFAQKSALAISNARKQIANVIGADENEIYFTGSGTESDNWALKSAVEVYKGTGAHIITSAIEHHAILHTAEWLGKNGCDITIIGVDKDGVVDLAELENAIRKETVLISIMFANNEIGTIQPIKEIGEIAKKHGVLFHTDAVQAFGQVPIDVNELQIDLLSASAHKLHGPKGVGMLYARKGTKIASFIHGGGQERKKRSGTENVAGIAGFGKAAEIAVATMQQRSEREIQLRDYLMGEIERIIPYCRLNGHRVQRLPNNANYSFEFIEGESMLLMLDVEGICASSGSACTSGSLDPSHVLLAIGLKHETAHGSLRLTLNHETTTEELDYVVANLEKIIQKLRSMSPLYEDFNNKQIQS